MTHRTIIYDASTQEFCDDVKTNRITDIMKDNFEKYFGRSVQDSEFHSWHNSLQYVKNVIELGKLKDNKK